MNSSKRKKKIYRYKRILRIALDKKKKKGHIAVIYIFFLSPCALCRESGLSIYFLDGENPTPRVPPSRKCFFFLCVCGTLQTTPRLLFLQAHTCYHRFFFVFFFFLFASSPIFFFSTSAHEIYRFQLFIVFRNLLKSGNKKKTNIIKYILHNNQFCLT